MLQQLRPRMFQNYILKSLTSKWRMLSNIHKNESCYIFGSGGSIKWFDLTCFNDKPGIATGKLHYHKDYLKLDCIKYFVFPEPWIFVPHPFIYLDRHILHRKRMQFLKPIAKDINDLITTKKKMKTFINLSNAPFIKGENIYYMWRNLPIERNSTDKSLNTHDLFSGSFFASLTVAYFLGFKKIYLIGFDAFTIEPTLNLRFYEHGKGEIGKNTPRRIDIQFE